MNRLAIVLATALLVAGLSALTRAPYSARGATDALLRFSWRTTVTAREHCRARTPEELEKLPVHMRTPEVCEPDDARYVLITAVDGAQPDTLALLRGGVKGDRPLFVLEERPLPPGSHRVGVQLLRLGDGAPEALAAPLDTVLELSAGAVRLITIDPETRVLTVRE